MSLLSLEHLVHPRLFVHTSVHPFLFYKKILIVILRGMTAALILLSPPLAEVLVVAEEFSARALSERL